MFRDKLRKIEMCANEKEKNNNLVKKHKSYIHIFEVFIHVNKAFCIYIFYENFDCNKEKIILLRCKEI